MNPNAFIHALQPVTSSSEAVVCPKLEELVLVLYSHITMAHIMSVIEIAAARESRGEKIMAVRIVGERDAATFDVSELRKHVWNVEYGSRVSLWVPVSLSCSFVSHILRNTACTLNAILSRALNLWIHV